MKFIKKIVAGVVLLALAVGVLGFGRATMQETWAEEDSVKIDGDWSYKILEDGTAEITGYGGNEKEVAVPAEINGHKVVRIDSGTFRNNKLLEDIVIPDGVTMIYNGMFANCTSLKSVEIPNSVTGIGFDIFFGCTSLESIELPDSVTGIGEDVFRGCTSLKSIEMSSGVTTIGGEAFFGCTSLENIKLSDSLTVIGREAFRDCESLEYIDIPDGAIIGYEAFAGCHSLKNINIPKSMTSIEYGTFRLCDKLEYIKIPDNVTDIGIGAFESCGLKKVNIPGSVANIEYEAFAWSALESVEISEGVTNIGKQAFFDCYGLESINIPKSVTIIGEKAFGYISDPVGYPIKVPDFTIYGYPDTAAETYAIENGFAFVDLTDAEEPTEKPSENPTETLTDSSITFNASGEFSPKLEMTKGEALSAIAKYFTEEQLSSVKAGKTALEIKLTVNNIDASVSESDKALIAKAVADLPDSDKLKFKVFDYLDIRLDAVIDGKELTIPETEGAVTVSIAPLKPTNETYKVVRIHDGKTDILDAQLNDDGTRLTFKTDRFSTYAIIYADVASGSSALSLPIIAFLLAASAVIAAGAALAIKEFKTLGEK